MILGSLRCLKWYIKWKLGWNVVFRVCVNGKGYVKWIKKIIKIWWRKNEYYSRVWKKVW